MTSKQAAIYTRISRDDADDRLAVTRQEEDCRALAARLGWTVAEVYTDNDVSATKAKVRPSYERMLADLESGHRDAVIVYDLDRLTRKPIELEGFIDLADRRKVGLANVSGDVDLTTSGGRMTARIKGAVARQEAERISERVRRANQQRAASGLPSSGGKRPFGYQDNKMSSNPEEAEEIRRAAARLLAGESLGAIVRDWNERGVLPTADRAGKRRAEVWSRPAVKAVLTGPRIAGLRLHQGQIAGPGTWEPILARETWDGLCAVLNSPRRKSHPGANTRKHLLAGFLVCGVCGAGLCSNPTKIGPVYRCSPERTTASGTRLGCGGVYRSARHVDAHVSAVVVERLTQLPLDKQHQPSDSLAAELAAAQRKCQELQAAYNADLLPMQDFLPLIKRARERVLDVERRRSVTLRSSVLQGFVGPGAAERWQSAGLERQRAVLGQLVTAVVVHRQRGRGPKRFDPTALEFVWRED